MELFAKLFGSLLVFVYHCFDRIVIHGYLSGLSRPEQVVYFFPQRRGSSGGRQGSAQPAHQPLPEVGGGFCPQPPDPHRVGREGRAERRLRPALAAGDGAGGPLRRLFHFQEHGAGTDLPVCDAQVPDPGPQSPHLGRLNGAASRTTTSTFGTRC